MRARSIFFAGLLVAELMHPTTSAAQSWNQIAQINGMGRVSACYFFNETTGIIGFDQVQNGSPLLRTTDGGITWLSVVTPFVTINWTCDIWFRDSLEGWATFLDGSSAGFLWHSTDGGQSWSALGLNGTCTGVRATSKTLVVTQYDGPIGVLTSVDNGASFSIDYGVSQNGLDFVDDQHGATGDYGGIASFAYTTDGGLSWRPATGPSDESWSVLGLQGTSTFLASSEISGEILRSTDYGAKWNIISAISGNGSMTSSSGTIYIQTVDAGLFSSPDTGITWTNIGGPTNGLDCRIAAFPCLVYAFDAFGGVWKNSSSQPFFITTTPLNFDTLSPCETHDTSISFINAECGPVTISGRVMSQQGKGYSVAGSGNTPFSLAPGDTASLQIAFDGTHTGTLFDTVVITVNDGSNSAWRIPIQTIVPPVDSVQFHLQTLPTLIPSQHFTVDVMPDRIVNASKGLTFVSGRIGYFRNNFVFDSITSTEGFQFQSSKPFTNNGKEEVDFSVLNANGISLDSQTPIAQLWLESVLTDSIDYSIALDSVLLNNGDPSFSNCTLATSSFGVSPQLQLLCGDSVLINSMLDRALFSASSPIPNPLSWGSDPNGVSQINMKALADGDAVLEIYDALGRMMHSEHYTLASGQTTLCPINLQGSPAGSYFYTIRFTSSDAIASCEGSILIVQ